MKLVISEQQVMDAITSVLLENRKVLKVGTQQAPPMPPAAPAPDMGMPPMGGDPAAMDGDPAAMSGDPAAMDGQDGGMQFDTNFDAGVEADEETDPKHYIQQLTGKLSQSLNSFNNEQGPDAGLSKYVASMIIAAACKNLDEKAKKELIEKINTASSSDEEEIPEEPEMGDEGDMGVEDGGGEPQQPMPMNEHVYTKKKLQEFMGVQDRQDNLQSTAKPQAKKSIFSGKSF